MTYGRHFKEETLEPKVERTEASCKKCRHLIYDDKICALVCQYGHDLIPCVEFSDASKQRDYFVNFQTGRY